MKRLLRRIVAAVCTSGAFAVPAGAQDPYRQTIVVTAAATPVELGTATRTVAVVSRDEIARLPVASVADLLRLVASVDVRARGWRGAQTDFAVRGAGFGQMLVLVDGVRINDAQSGHHNGDIPVPLDAVERIEILQGVGSSLFGADAFGGTVNVITRRAVRGASFTAGGGSFGSAALAGHAGYARGSWAQSFAASLDRSSGFMYDRDHHTTLLRSRTAVGESGTVSASFLRKEFGANNFYGGNAPSREWTNQTLVAADRRWARPAGWSMDVQASYRTHGDRFVFNQTNPQLSDNRHRTHATLVTVVGSRPIGRGTLALGAEAGAEWIRSTNLGDHSLTRGSGFGEWRQPLGPRTQLDASLRVDRYSEFGTAWSPAVGAGWWAARSVRVRGSAGRAFRVPTFTERYYSDPANLARPEVGAERAWSGEAGVDVFLAGGWFVHSTAFARADSDVIDWLRPTVADRWRTYNIRDVDTRGLEVGVRRSFGTEAFALASFTALGVRAPAVTQLSKYALDYAPRSFVAAASTPLPAGFRIAPRVEYRRRSRSTGSDEYVLIDARVSRPLGAHLDVQVDGTNLLDARYEEIAGVAMPGAAVMVSIAVRSSR